MDNILYDVCLDAAKNCKWDLKEIKKYIYDNRHMFKKDNITPLEVLVYALYASKKNDFLDKYIRIIERKNGAKVADYVFKQIFPKLNSIDDLYDYCYKLIVNKVNLHEKSPRIGISISMIKYYARESKIGLLPDDVERLEKKRENIIQNYPDFYRTIMFLYEHDDQDEINDFCAKMETKVDFTFITQVSNVLFPFQSFAEVQEKVVDKYLRYKKYRDYILNADLKVREEASKVIRKFIDGPMYSITAFCDLEDMKKRTFFTKGAIVKKHNPELYMEYCEKVARLRKKDDLVVPKKMWDVVNYIVNGINGREFTILDYLKIMSVPVPLFYNAVRGMLNDEQKCKVYAFFCRYKDMNILTMKSILQDKQEINCQIGDDGIPIPGTGHLITSSEKRMIIKQIEADGFPLYDGVYACYVRERFPKEDAKIKKKSK